jgi:anti-sigma B factor antagonist
VSVERWPVRWAGKTVIVEFPAEIDVNNAARIRALLMSLVEESAAQVVVVDMAGTTFCDSSGATALATAHLKAAARGAEVKIVATTGPVLRIFELTGLDQVLAIFPTMAAALAAPQ